MIKINHSFNKIDWQIFIHNIILYVAAIERMRGFAKINIHVFLFLIHYF